MNYLNTKNAWILGLLSFAWFPCKSFGDLLPWSIDPLSFNGGTYSLENSAGSALECGVKLVQKTLLQNRAVDREKEAIQLSDFVVIQDEEIYHENNREPFGFTRFHFLLKKINLYFVWGGIRNGPSTLISRHSFKNLSGYAKIYFVNYFDKGKRLKTNCGYDFYNQHLPEDNLVFSLRRNPLDSAFHLIDVFRTEATPDHLKESQFGSYDQFMDQLGKFMIGRTEFLAEQDRIAPDRVPVVYKDTAKSRATFLLRVNGAKKILGRDGTIKDFSSTSEVQSSAPEKAKSKEKDPSQNWGDFFDSVTEWVRSLP